MVVFILLIVTSIFGNEEGEIPNSMKNVQTKILAIGSIVAILVVAAALLVGTGGFSAFASKATSTSNGSQGTDFPALNYKAAGLSQADVAAADGGTLLAAGTAHNYVSVDHWKSTFVSNGITYKYSMVGNAPSTNSSATIPVNIIPVNLTVNYNGVTSQWNGTDVVAATVNSPLFKKANFTSGNTQYVDAIQRAEFFSQISSKYHVLLGKPNVMAPLNLTAPAGLAVTATTSSGLHIAVVDLTWYDSHLQSALQGTSTKAITIFLSHNTMKGQGAPLIQNCCIGGYHNAVKINHQLFTYAEATFDDGAFSIHPASADFSRDVNALSHELAEWANDPFVNNITPNWISPIAPQYGCNNFLEVGDPLVGVTIPPASFGGYHLQDEAFFSWFARQTPSIAQGGRYTYLGTFTGLSAVC